MTKPSSKRGWEVAIVILVALAGAVAAASGLHVPSGSWIVVIGLAWAFLTLRWLLGRKQ
jgi:hypothetical protein